MRKGAYTFYGFIALMLLLLALLWLKHGNWLAHPNDFILGGDGDGLKNTFTTIWHIRRDQNSVHYTGMNAPWGEHVAFTDCQPLVANALRFVQRHFIRIEGHELELLNWFVILSQLACAAFIYLIFRRLHLPVWYAALAAVGLTLLAPQNARLTAGHLSLANSFVVPMLFWFLIHYEERNYRRPWSVGIAVAVVCGAMIHFYFFGFAVLFLTLYHFFQVARNWSFSHFRRRLAHWVVQVLLPLAVVDFWLNLGHSVIDRPDSPYGFNDYRAKPSGVFLPDWAVFSDKSSLDLENKAYIGLLAVLFTAWLVARRFQFYDKKWDVEAVHRRQKRFLSGLCFSGLMLLIFALGFPFSIPKWGDFLLSWAGPLRQFRGTGRFVWPYFFVANLLFFYVLWQTARRWREVWLTWASFAAAFSILFLEAFLTQKSVDLHPQPNFLSNEIRKLPIEKQLDLSSDKTLKPLRFDWLGKINFSKMQGIVPLPFYHAGSELFESFCNPSIFKKTQVTAIETGLPDLACNLSRTSLSQTIKSVQLIGAPLEIPAILDELPTAEPLAIFCDATRFEKNWFEYGHLMQKADLIWSDDELKIYRLPLDSLRATVFSEAKKVETEMTTRPLTKLTTGWLSTSSAPAGLFSAGWELNPAERIFQGRGSLVGSFADSTLLFKSQMPQGRFSFSIWQFIGEGQAWAADAVLTEKNGLGAELQNRFIPLRHETRAIVGQWALHEFEFEVLESGSLVSLVVLPKTTSRESIFFDEMLIRPIGVDVYKKTDGWVVKNNYWHRF